MHKKCPALVNTKWKIFLHDNVRPHITELNNLGYESLPHPPDLSPDYHLFQVSEQLFLGKNL